MEDDSQTPASQRKEGATTHLRGCSLLISALSKQQAKRRLVHSSSPQAVIDVNLYLSDCDHK